MSHQRRHVHLVYGLMLLHLVQVLIHLHLVYVLIHLHLVYLLMHLNFVYVLRTRQVNKVHVNILVWFTGYMQNQFTSIVCWLRFPPVQSGPPTCGRSETRPPAAPPPDPHAPAGRPHLVEALFHQLAAVAARSQ